MIEKAGELIKQGKIVIFPTETVYGIGTNGLDENAVRKLYEVKKRPLNKPISLLVSNMEMVNLIAKDITETEYKIMKNFFPGPLTIILKKKKNVPDIVTAGQDTVGVRMPRGDVARKLVELSGVPIAAPSANISGEPSGTNLQEIMKHFEGKVDYCIDGGNSELGLASTIVQVIDDKPMILRQGSITLEQINKILKEWNLKFNTKTGEISCNENKITINGKELELLETLLINKNQIMDRETLANKIWGYDSEAEYNNVEVYISFLRKKLRLLKANIKIKAIRGIGYKMEVEND